MPRQDVLSRRPDAWNVAEVQDTAAEARSEGVGVQAWCIASWAVSLTLSCACCRLNLIFSMVSETNPMAVAESHLAVTGS